MLSNPNNPFTDIPEWGAERRQVRRVIFRSVVRLMFSSEESVDVHALDISPGGMGVVAPVNPPPGTLSVVHAALPIGQGASIGIKVQARTTQSILSAQAGGFKIGLQFVNVPESTSGKILNFINSRTSAASWDL